MSNNVNQQVEREVVFGIVPVLPRERKYNFPDAFLVLSGYCIATWSYTQGSYLAGLVGFQQLLIGAFFAAILLLAIYQLPTILSVRYGIDVWVWLKSVFGPRGVQIMTVTIIAINFVPLMAIVAVIATFTWRRTGSHIPGAALSAMLISWYVVVGQATQA